MLEEVVGIFKSGDLSVFLEAQRALHHVTAVFSDFGVKHVARCVQGLSLEAAPGSECCCSGGVGALWFSVMLVKN